jgi:hypothetical protein
MSRCPCCAAMAAVVVLAGCSGAQPRPTPTPTAGYSGPRDYQPQPEQAPAEGPPPAGEVAPPPPAAASGPAAGAARGAEADADYQRKLVTYYFSMVDFTLRAPKHGVPAELTDADALLASLQQKAEKIRGLTVPAACADHHRQVLGLLDGSMALADRMRALRNTQDPSVKLSFAADRSALGEQEKQIDTLAAEIKQQMAAPPPPPPQD